MSRRTTTSSKAIPKVLLSVISFINMEDMLKTAYHGEYDGNDLGKATVAVQ